MSNILVEISTSQVDQETCNGGENSSYCHYLNALAVIEAGLCMAGAISSCASHRSLLATISTYCR